MTLHIGRAVAVGAAPLAEAPQFTPADVAMIIVVLLGMLLVVGAVAVLGFVLARKAAAGSSQAMIGWIGVVALETLFGLALLVSGGWMVAAVVAIVLAVQVSLFLSGRNSRSGPPGEQ
ncbi:MAG TPA: hypothetical protein VHJ78_01720 [Actinomycetota bacterium]|nr:hypothetical protein [Actinomycetota bacterium]